MALMEEKPYSRITVQDICKQADLSRQTFYNVFDSKEEILRFQMQLQYKKQFQRFSDQSTITVAEIVEAFTAVVEENDKLLQQMISNGLDSIIFDEVTKCVSLFAGHFVKECGKNEMFPYAETMLSGAVGYLLFYWFRQENPISMDKLAYLISEFLEGNLFALVE